jgi:hypothetical protein
VANSKTTNEMEITLDSLTGFGGSHKWDDKDIKAILADSQAKKELTEDFKRAMAKTLGVTPGDITVADITIGSVHIKFSVSNLNSEQKNSVIKEGVKLFQPEFATVLSVKVSPLFHELGFDVSSIDNRGLRFFMADDKYYFKIGPPDSLRNYHPPIGWKRVGLAVLNSEGKASRYENDLWLHPFENNPNLWYRAYHGTTHSAFLSIANEGLKPSKFGLLGPGVYVSPHVEIAESFSKPIKVVVQEENGKEINKFYICVFQLAVRPGSITKEDNPTRVINPELWHQYYGDENSEWVIKDPKNVRPYAILWKECVSQPT